MLLSGQNLSDRAWIFEPATLRAYYEQFTTVLLSRKYFQLHSIIGTPQAHLHQYPPKAFVAIPVNSHF